MIRAKRYETVSEFVKVKNIVDCFFR